MFYSLRNRLILFFVILLVLSFSTLAILLFNEARSVIRSYIESSALEKMDEYGSYVDMVQTQIYDLASLVFNSDTTEKWDAAVSNPEIGSGEKMLAHLQMSQFLTRAANSYSSVSSVSIYRQEGLWVGSGSGSPVESGDFFKQEDWYVRFFAEGKHWVAAHRDQAELEQNNMHPVVSMLMPIGNFEPSRSRSVMKINIDADYFTQPLDRIHLGEKGTIYLLDENGQPLLEPSSFEIGAADRENIRKIRSGSAKQGVLYVSDEQSRTSIIVYKKLAMTDWILIGKVSEADLYANLFKLRVSIVVAASVLLLTSVIVASLLSYSITKPLSKLVSAMNDIKRGDFEKAQRKIPPALPVHSEIGYVTFTFGEMTRQLNEHIKTEFELKLLRQQAEYKALLLQINPHFLFNTLELLSSLAMQKRTDDTVSVIESLGKMLRFSLHIQDDLTTVREELKYVRDYVAILQIRFGDRLHIDLKQQPGLDELKMIKFILQPLIENAVKYSLPQRRKATVNIEVYREQRHIHLTVQDNGPGMSDGSVHRFLHAPSPARLEQILSSSSWHIGLGNVLARCRLYYGDSFTVHIYSPPLDDDSGPTAAGTRIELVIPVTEHMREPENAEIETMKKER
ncbi:sensor histidine kinase [Saccharibacillus sacchari]|uniref:Sensor histidine kinase n=1 Tax=Saccharibacillus sacchari TaxID=456493 RepID=A0ACC6P791_9BACL